MSKSKTAVAVQPISQERADEYLLSHVGGEAPTLAPGDDVYALRVRGDSMVDSAGAFSFPDGCMIVVNATLTAMPGDHVVVRLKGVQEAIFRKLECDGDVRFLKPLNPEYPNMSLPSDAKIAGVVTQVEVRIRRRAA